MNYKLVYSCRAKSEAKKIEEHFLKEELDSILLKVSKNPLGYRPKKKLKGFKIVRYSIRLNLANRVVYSIHRDTNIIKVHSVWGHY